VDAQPELTNSVWDYLDILVNEDRVQNGKAILTKYRGMFDAVEKAYGVDHHFIAAIWGVESNYGTQIGERSVIRSTATLACIGRRQDYFREELLSALEILSRGDVTPAHLKGSWAGAFGPTQFMPTSFKRLRRGLRRRRPSPRRRLDAGCGGLHRETISRRMVGSPVKPGATRSWCRKASISCSPIARASWRCRNGSDWASRAPGASLSRARRIAPICWCRQVRKVPLS